MSCIVLTNKFAGETLSVALRPKAAFVLGATFALAAAVPRLSAAQHITIDGRFSPAQTLVGTNYSITAGLGKQVGSNLFHSFGQFGLATGESAAFSGPATVNNVIGRVTGGTTSSIDGKVQSNIAGANLYLINPSGIVFGPHATVNVSGSFHASTADYLKMSDGAKFQATNPDTSTLSAAPPAAFGFLTARPAAVTVNGSALGPVQGTLGLVGGPVSINNGAALSAPAGTIHVTSAASTGEVPVEPRNTPALTVTSFGPVDIRGGSKLDVSDRSGLGSGGSVFIHSDALTIDASEINADNYGAAAGGQILLRGEDQVSFTNTAYVHALTLSGSGAGVAISTAPLGVTSADASIVLTESAGRGNAGPLSVSTGQLTLTKGALLGTVAAGSGRGGDISIGVTDRLLIDGSAGPPLEVGVPATGIASTTVAVSPTGSAGNITIKAGSLLIGNKGGIASSTFGSASSGNISIDVAGQLDIDQSLATGINLTVILGIESQANPASTGAAGTVMVRAGSLSIRNNGEISSSTFGPGQGGDVSIKAGALAIANGAIVSETFGSGNGGNVNIDVATDLSLTADSGSLARISTLSLLPTGSAFPSSGNAGNITIGVTGKLSLNGGESGIAIITADTLQTSGNGGNVTVRAGSLSLISGGEITSDTGFGLGRAGRISVRVDGELSIDGGSQGIAAISSISGSSSGDAGSLAVAAGDLTIINGGQIATSTLGAAPPARSGNAGAISVNATDSLMIDGTKTPTGFTGIRSDAGEGSTDNAGKIAVAAGALSIVNNGEIMSSTSGPGSAGSVAVNVTGQLTIDDSKGKPAAGATGIFAQANPGSDGAAGIVSVGTGTLVIKNNGTISSTTFGPGHGGDVSVGVDNTAFIDASGANPAFRTGITAQTQGAGNAGTVTLAAGDLRIIDGGSVVSTTAGTGAGGSVVVTTPGGLVLDGEGTGNTQIAASALGQQSGPGGSVTVQAGTLMIKGGAQIASSTAGRGRGGDVEVKIADAVTLSGVTVNGTASGITAAALPRSSGQAGEVVLAAGGALALSGGAEVSSSTAGVGNGGSVRVTAQGPLVLSDPGSGIVALAMPSASGNAGSVTVTAPQITLTAGGAIASTTTGTGAGGSVNVMTPGTLALSGRGDPNTEIAASAKGLNSGPGGNVMVAAGSLRIEGGHRSPALPLGSERAAMSISPSRPISCCQTRDRKSRLARPAAATPVRSPSRLCGC